MTKQFAGAIGQVSNQVNMVIMGLAGAHRLFALLDEQPETDEGYVTLVNARENKDGTIEECSERTGVWAWKHPHHDGTLTYTRLMGDVRFFDVNFGYTPEKTVLHNISLYAKPGQKLAFVGSTGAGKTTITTSSTASTISTMARSVTTVSTSTRSRRPICATRWASSCRTPTSSPAR